jgi:serine/threonine-protein kinase RsbW
MAPKSAKKSVTKKRIAKTRPAARSRRLPVNFHSDNLALVVETTIPADRNAIDPVVQKIMGTVRQMQCAAGKEDAIELALSEALANAVVHGCGCDPTKKVECCVACDEKAGMLIVVRDPGNGFNAGQIPNPVRGENIFSNHGRGIYLINQLMDEVRFHRNGAEIHMIKR